MGFFFTGDRGFESTSLQRRVRSKPVPLSSLSAMRGRRGGTEPSDVGSTPENKGLPRRISGPSDLRLPATIGRNVALRGSAACGGAHTFGVSKCPRGRSARTRPILVAKSICESMPYRRLITLTTIVHRSGYGTSSKRMQPTVDIAHWLSSHIRPLPEPSRIDVADQLLIASSPHSPPYRPAGYP
jgi:hypothetical protein